MQTALLRAITNEKGLIHKSFLSILLHFLFAEKFNIIVFALLSSEGGGGGGVAVGMV